MKTIFRKLLENFVITIIICLVIAGVNLSIMIRGYIFEQKEEELILKAQDIAKPTKHFFINNENPNEYINTINHLDSHLGTEVWAVDKDGVVITAAAKHSNYEGSKLNNWDLKEILSGKLAVDKGYSEYFQEPVIRVIAPVIENDKAIGAIIVYSPIRGIDEVTKRLILMIVLAGVISLFIALVLCVITAKRIAKPIQDLALVSIEVANGDRNVQVPINTEFKEFNQLVQAFNYMLQKLEQNEKKMKDFVVNVSHELKSPITSIKGFIEALIDGKDKTTEHKQKFLNIMEKEANRLSKLIENLLILYRAENDNYFEPQRINIVEFIKETLISYEINASMKSIKLMMKNQLKPIYTIVDPHSLKQIMINLLDNALNYSPMDGEIIVQVDIHLGRVRILVIDNGPGIPEEEILNIWDRFYRVDKARSRATGGTGLGLSIVKELVFKNHGSVSVNSSDGKGSTFIIELPGAN